MRLISSAPESTPRRARAGVSWMFFTNGILFSSLLPRYPELKSAFGLTNSEFGLLLVSFPVGALLAAAFAGRVIRRVGVLRTNAIGSLALAATMAVAGASFGLANGVLLFALMLMAAGAIDSVVDAAQNVQGVLVEEWRGSSVMNSLHAMWSVGAAGGGLIGASAAAAGVTPGVQMTINGAVWACVALAACRAAEVPAAVQPSAPDAARETAPGSMSGAAWRLLLPLVVLAICGTLVEDIANNWAALYLGQVTEAPTAVAGLGVTVALGAQFVGRLCGDPMTDRWGRAAVARTGGLLVSLGAALVVLAPTYALAFGGFAIAGFGCATLVPAAFAAAGRVPGLPEGTGIAVLGWLMRLGFLITSPTVGTIADLTNLRVGLLVPVGAGLVAAVIAQSQLRSSRRGDVRQER